jgi:hypothetical protein
MTNGRNYFFCETESNFVSHLRLDERLRKISRYLVASENLISNPKLNATPEFKIQDLIII